MSAKGCQEKSLAQERAAKTGNGSEEVGVTGVTIGPSKMFLSSKGRGLGPLGARKMMQKIVKSVCTPCNSFKIFIAWCQIQYIQIHYICSNPLQNHGLRDVFNIEADGIHLFFCTSWFPGHSAGADRGSPQNRVEASRRFFGRENLSRRPLDLINRAMVSCRCSVQSMTARDPVGKGSDGTCSMDKFFQVHCMLHIPDDPCMVYLPTKRGHLWGKCR